MRSGTRTLAALLTSVALLGACTGAGEPTIVDSGHVAPLTNVGLVAGGFDEGLVRRLAQSVGVVENSAADGVRGRVSLKDGHAAREVP